MKTLEVLQAENEDTRSVMRIKTLEVLQAENQDTRSVTG